MHRPRLASTAAYIAWYACHTPDAPAIMQPGTLITYRALATGLIGCAHALEVRGVGPETLVGVETTDRYLHLLLLLACDVLGAASVSLSAAELAEAAPITRHCGLILAAHQPAAGLDTPVCVIPANWPDAFASAPDDLALLSRTGAPDKLARVLRTSGTTGEPKAMPVSFALQRLRIARAIDRLALEVRAAPRMLCLYPVAVAGMLVRMLSVLQVGGTVIFSIEAYAPALIAAGAVNLALFTAADLERCVAVAVPPPDGHPLRVLVFGVGVPARLRQQVRERLRAAIDNPYSASETNPIAMLEEGDVGMLCPGVEVRVVDHDGRDLPQGDTGVVRVRTETMVPGYFCDPERTAAYFIDGWYHTNDLGRVPHPGMLQVFGRADDMLNIGGVKVPPLAIEAPVKQVEGVSDAVAMSVPGPHGTDSLLVAVEVSDDHVPPGLEAAVRGIVSVRFRHFAFLPMRWFPRTASGKVRRQDIAAVFRQSQLRDGTEIVHALHGVTRT